MGESKDNSKKLNKKIGEIQKQVIEGKISLLDLELVPIFNELKNSLNVYNLNMYSLTYKEACSLLKNKFNELKKLLTASNIEQNFLQYINANPSEEEISQLFSGCWNKIFSINALSFQFLMESKDRLCHEKPHSFVFESQEEEKVNDEFILEIPMLKFTEKMNKFFNSIQNMLPCSFESIFERERDDLTLCNNFVYLLHLLQTGKIKYQQETHFLYCED